MGTYTKLQSSILHSTVWMEPNHIRILWITMLAMKDKNGIVEASIPGLASVARITNEECEEGLNRLSAPDRYSRTSAHNGRRIESMEGGWIILNHEKYRGDTSTDRVRRHRAKKQDETQCNVSSFPKRCETDGTRETASVSGSVSESVSNQENKSRNPQTPKVGSPPSKSKNGYSQDFENFWSCYPRRVGKGPASKAFERAKKAGLPDHLTVAIIIEKHKKGAAWLDDNGKYIPHPATWLNQRRWEDDVEPYKPKTGKTQQELDKLRRQRNDRIAREQKGDTGHDRPRFPPHDSGLPGESGDF